MLKLGNRGKAQGLPIEPPCMLVPAEDPGVLRPKSLVAEALHGSAWGHPPTEVEGTTQSEAQAPMDVSTDPDTNMDMQQAHVRNMRSKCRCSCVLQFTLRHGVSSVLHRPPSQMIHCMVLYLVSCLAAGEALVENRCPHARQGGSTEPEPEARLFEAGLPPFA